jgi:hypothetical protein
MASSPAGRRGAAARAGAPAPTRVAARLDTPLLATGAVVMVGTLMPILDIAVVNIALPSL